MGARIGRAVAFFLLFLCPACLADLRAASAPAAPPPRHEIAINLPAFRLYLYRDGQLIRDYPVAIGAAETPTPTGAYRIVCKVRNPVWYPPNRRPVPPGPENPLGPWWLGLDAQGYGIHGCSDESSIGRAVSKGCIRMYNRDVVDLVKQVPVGTAVSIVYQLFLVREDPHTGLLWLWVGRDVYRRAAAWVDEALAGLRASATLSWDEEACRAVLASAEPPGWYEVPRPVAVYRDGNLLGQAYLLSGRIWLPRALAGLLPGGEGLEPGEGAVGLDDLMMRAGEGTDWGFDPTGMVLTCVGAGGMASGIE
ncbi:MAG: L,D-transpeptidase [Bacteroidota bacterium]